MLARELPYVNPFSITIYNIVGIIQASDNVLTELAKLVMNKLIQIVDLPFPIYRQELIFIETKYCFSYCCDHVKNIAQYLFFVNFGVAFM